MRFGLLVLGLCLTPGLSAQEPPAVPFHLIDGWAIVLDGTLGGIPNCRIMIDTGAVPSAISAKFARRLGLTGSFQKLSAMNRSIDAQSLRVPDVRIGALSAEALDMMAVDLSRIEQRLNTRIDAAIGLDFLAGRNFRIDYRRKKLVFGNGASGERSVVFEVQQEAGGSYILVPLTSGDRQLQLLLDTGTNDLTLFDRRVGSMLRHMRVLGRDFSVTAGGQAQLVAVEMDSVHVGPISRKRQKAFVLAVSEQSLRGFDGVLGPAALGVREMGFDFDRHLVSFETR